VQRKGPSIFPQYEATSSQFYLPLLAHGPHFHQSIREKKEGTKSEDQDKESKIPSLKPAPTNSACEKTSIVGLTDRDQMIEKRVNTKQEVKACLQTKAMAKDCS
jgi:hypothetical protein